VGKKNTKRKESTVCKKYGKANHKPLSKEHFFFASLSVYPNCRTPFRKRSPTKEPCSSRKVHLIGTGNKKVSFPKLRFQNKAYDESKTRSKKSN